MKTYLVSGAGSGIGRAISQNLAAASSENSIALLGRNRANLEHTLETLPKPERHLVLEADLTDRESVAHAVSKLKNRNLAGVIANAGVGGENRYGAHGNGDRWSEVIATNLTGTYILVNEVLPALRASRTEFRHVILISSILARLGVPGYSAYCASKAGLLGLMRSWAAELAPEKILVNAICPGWVATDMARDGIAAFARASGRSNDEVLAEQMKPVPLGKMSRPEEIGSLVGYLVSGAQNSITGQALDMNNGALMP